MRHQFSDAPVPTIAYNSDVHFDDEFSNWNIWAYLRFEILSGDNYLLKIGEAIHFGSPQILGLARLSESGFRDAHSIHQFVFDEMKRVITKLREHADNRGV